MTDDEKEEKEYTEEEIAKLQKEFLEWFFPWAKDTK